MTSLISNPQNTTIKRIRSLRQRKEREQSGLCFVEGIRIVAEAIQVGAPITQLVVAPSLLISPFALDLVDKQRRAGTTCLEVSPGVFKSLSTKDNPQGLAAVVRQRWSTLDTLNPEQGLCWVALSGVHSPGNLGTILRTSDAVGSAGVILVGHTTDPYDPEAVRAGMGAIFSQQVVRANLAQVRAWKASHSIFVVGTSDAAASDYRTITYTQPLLLLMGSEQQGLSEEEIELCDAVVRIPMVGRSDSLNLAVATGVVLYEIFYQHRGSVGGPGGATSS